MRHGQNGNTIYICFPPPTGFNFTTAKSLLDSLIYFTDYMVIMSILCYIYKEVE